MEKNEVMMADLAADAEKVGINLAAILALVSAFVKIMPQIIEIINQFKGSTPKPDATPDGSFPAVK